MSNGPSQSKAPATLVTTFLFHSLLQSASLARGSRSVTVTGSLSLLLLLPAVLFYLEWRSCESSIRPVESTVYCLSQVRQSPYHASLFFCFTPRRTLVPPNPTHQHGVPLFYLAFVLRTSLHCDWWNGQFRLSSKRRLALSNGTKLLSQIENKNLPKALPFTRISEAAPVYSKRRRGRASAWW